MRIKSKVDPNNVPPTSPFYRKEPPITWVSNNTSDIETGVTIMKRYLLLKFEQGDWHGVADAANDIREMLAREKK
jgi:hypothetical protein